MTGQIWNTSEDKRSHDFSGPCFQYFTTLMKKTTTTKKKGLSTPPKTQSSCVYILWSCRSLSALLPNALGISLNFYWSGKLQGHLRRNKKLSCIIFVPCTGAKSVVTQQHFMCGWSKTFYLLGKFPLNHPSIWQFAALLP